MTESIRWGDPKTSLNDFVLNSELSVADRYSLPYLAQETIHRTRHKDKFKQALRGLDLPVVQTLTFSDITGLKERLNKIGYPAVVKPVDLGGSGGIQRIDEGSDLETIFQELQTHVETHGRNWNVTLGRYVVERYIDSIAEVSVEFLVDGEVRVFGVTDKYLAAEPYFGEIGHRVPSQWTGHHEIVSKITQILSRAIRPLGLDRGICHAELKIDSNNDV